MSRDKKTEDDPDRGALLPAMILFLIFWAVIAAAVLTAGGNNGMLATPWGYLGR
jgi:hypothetical protein